MKSKYYMHPRRKFSFLLLLSSLLLLLPALNVQAQTQLIAPIDDGGTIPLPLPSPTPLPVCSRTIKADVVALDQAIMYNRLGAINPGGMI